MKGFYTLFKQALCQLLTPATLTIFLIFPSVLTFLMGFLFDGLYNTTLVSSYDFYGVTMIVFIAMMGATVPANIFLEKHLKSGNTRIFYSPVSRVCIYMAKILACFVVMSLCISINMILFQVTSFVNLGGSRISYVILLMGAFVLFLILLSTALCVTIHSEELTNVIISNSMSVLGLLSGIFFPIASLGDFFEMIAQFSPMKWTVDCLFQIIYDGRSEYYWWIIFGLVVLSLLLLMIVHRNYRPDDYI